MTDLTALEHALVSEKVRLRREYESATVGGTEVAFAAREQFTNTLTIFAAHAPDLRDMIERVQEY